jgi:hypothetical protein
MDQRVFLIFYVHGSKVVINLPCHSLKFKFCFRPLVIKSFRSTGPPLRLHWSMVLSRERERCTRISTYFSTPPSPRFASFHISPRSELAMSNLSLTFFCFVLILLIGVNSHPQTLPRQATPTPIGNRSGSISKSITPSLTLLDFLGNSTGDVNANSTGNSNTFSAANAFGIFLTLQFCQLTQPNGSLLFRGEKGWFWRVSPIASFVEVCIILYSLLFHRGVGWHRRRGFRVTAAALLLARGNAEDRSPEGRNQANSVLYRGSNEPYSLLPVTQPDESDTTSGPVDQIFDETAFPHKELRVAGFTALSVCLLSIKLFVVTGAPWFTASAACLVFGWFMIQLLLLLLHRKAMTNDEKRLKKSRLAKTKIWESGPKLRS